MCLASRELVSAHVSMFFTFFFFPSWLAGDVPATLEKVYSWVNWITSGNGTQEIVDFYFKMGIMSIAKALMRRRLADDKEHPLLVNKVGPSCKYYPARLARTLTGIHRHHRMSTAIVVAVSRVLSKAERRSHREGHSRGTCCPRCRAGAKG